MYESMSDIKRIERDERQQRREARREETASKDEEVWIEQQESLQIMFPDEVILSPVNPHTIIQTIVEDDL